MKRILLIINNLGNGGAERVFTNLVLFLSSRYKVQVLTIVNQGRYIDDIIKAIGKSNYFSLGEKTNTIYQYFRLRNKIVKIQPDLVLSFLRYSNMLSGLICKRLNIPYIVSERNNIRQDNYSGGIKGKIIKSLVIKSYRSADRVVSVSIKNKKFLVDDYKILPERIVCIHNGTEILKLEKLGKEFIDVEAFINSNSILAVGRLTQQKGFDVLIYAFKEVRKKIPDAKLFIIGEGILKEKLLALAVKEGLGGDVYFLGYVKNPYPYIKKAKVFVLSSRYEGSPNVLIEAYVLNGCLVSTNCETGPDEIITDNVDGFLVNVEDASMLAERIITLLIDRNKGTCFKKETKKNRSKFDNNNVFEKYIDTINMVIR